MKTLLLILFIAPLTLFGQWNQVGQDINGDNADDFLGWSVSLNADGTILAAGGIQNDAGGNNVGHVKVYQHNGSSWVQLGQDIVGDSSNENSGSSVELNSSGNIIAIGSQSYVGSDGRVRVFEFDGTSWTQRGQTINAEGPEDLAEKVSLNADGDVLAIGASGNNGIGVNSGHTRIFEFNGSAWVQMGQDIDGENAGDSSGSEINLSADGQTIAIGAPFSDFGAMNTGHTSVFQFDGNSWIQLGQNIIGEAANDLSGSAVKLNDSGDILAVGAFGNDGNGSFSGHVRVYQFDDVNWNQIGQDIDGANEGDFSGIFVDLSATGESIVIGAQLSDGNGTDSGEMRVFNYDGASWVQRGESIFGANANDKLANVNISSDGSRIVGAAPFASTVVGSESGQVRVYEFGNPPINNNPINSIPLQI